MGKIEIQNRQTACKRGLFVCEEAFWPAMQWSADILNLPGLQDTDWWPVDSRGKPLDAKVPGWSMGALGMPSSSKRRRVLRWWVMTYVCFGHSERSAHLLTFFTGLHPFLCLIYQFVCLVCRIVYNKSWKYKRKYWSEKKRKIKIWIILTKIGFKSLSD